MPSISTRQLRDTRQLFAWLEAGEVVELRKRDRVVARIVPESPKPEEIEWPDFEARAKAIFGDRIVPAVDDLIAERNSRF
jgi:antitoxin (DNA-binding transcriptional repressor) of toxin-antitoxin stability system